MSLGTLVPLAVASARDPRGVLARLLDVPMDRAVLWQALALVVVLSVILAEATNIALGMLGMTIQGPEGETAPLTIVRSPLLFGALQMVVLVAIVFAIFYIGRAMGGRGSLEGAILSIAWLQFVMVCLQVLQSAAFILAPPIGNLLAIAGLVLFLWLLTNFVAELHGFANLGRVFGMILFVALGAALALSFVLTLSGATVPR